MFAPLACTSNDLNRDETSENFAPVVIISRDCADEPDFFRDYSVDAGREARQNAHMLWKITKVILTIIGVTLDVIGLSGVPGDVETWMKYGIGTARLLSTIDQQNVRTWIIVVTSAILLSIWLIPLLLKRRAPQALKTNEEVREDPASGFTVTRNVDGTFTINISLSEEPRKKRPNRTFVVYRPHDMEILDSNNIVSITDNGARDFSFIFDEDFPAGSRMATVMSEEAVKWRIVESNRSHARIVFEDKEPEQFRVDFE